MPLGSGFGSDSIKLAIAGLQKLLGGQTMEEAEKSAFADIAKNLMAVEDHAIDDITNLEIVATVGFRRKA